MRTTWCAYSTRIILISRSIRTACRWCATTRANITGSSRAPAFERENHEVYALGEIDTREAISCLMTRRRLTAENTIEYMI